MLSDLKDKFQFAQESGLCVVAWRLPNESRINISQPAKERVWQGEESESPFFVFAPFSDEFPAFCTYADAQEFNFATSPKNPTVSDKLGYKHYSF